MNGPGPGRRGPWPPLQEVAPEVWSVGLNPTEGPDTVGRTLLQARDQLRPCRSFLLQQGVLAIHSDPRSDRVQSTAAWAKHSLGGGSICRPSDRVERSAWTASSGRGPERAVDRTASAPSVGRAPMDPKADGHQSKASSSGRRQMQHSTQSSEPSPDGGSDRLGRNLAAVERRLTDSQPEEGSVQALAAEGGSGAPSVAQGPADGHLGTTLSGRSGRTGCPRGRPSGRARRTERRRAARRTALAAIGTIRSSRIRTTWRPANSVKSLSRPKCFVSN